jgi:hypothetical protein
MKLIERTWIFVLIMLLPILTNAQEGGKSNCSENLRKAQNLYDNGIIQNIPILLEKCLNSYPKAQKTQAYRLLILSYLFDNKYYEADNYMQQLLKFDPLFILQDDEPIELKNLFNTYRTEPIYSLGVLAGGALNFIDVIKPFSTADLQNSAIKYKALPSFGVSAYFNSYLTDEIKFSLTINLLQNRYNINFPLLDYSETNLTESMMSLGLGMGFTYEFRLVKKTIIKPYINLGIEPNILLFSSITGERIYSDGSKPPFENQGLNTMNIRNHYNLAPYLSGGVKYRLGKAWLLFDLRYARNIFITNNWQTRYNNYDLLFKYFYVDSDFALQHFMFSVGLIQSFYNPTKKNETKILY